MKTKEEIEKLAEKHYTQITLSQRTAFKLGYTQCQKDMSKEPFKNFYLRLKNFVLDVKVNDPMSEEEKEMIISVCNKQINKQN